MGFGRFLLRRSYLRGFIGGSRFWTVLGTFGLAVRLLRKLTRDEPEVVYREPLGPGQSLLISHDRGAKVVRRRR